ncbi:MAG: uncharacterized protein KVP18_000892 [Porospora cf. gigantea A]|uniref:uncharacterized protein n=2 Tax=Porospora cf. gigantea A TaxID=2853593 RepID=UPI00355A4171|nr:MAG: hypothetical protein KVP18_000892 [Porospora cf. gigantea A]
MGPRRIPADFDVFLMMAAQLELLKETVSTLAVRCDKATVGDMKKTLKGFVLTGKNIRNVVEDPVNPKRRLILLTPETSAETVAPLLLEGAEIVTHSYDVGFEQMSANQALKKLLADYNVESVPTAYETIGHIAHLNLKETHLPFKTLIGDVILRKNGHIRTVVNKRHNLNDEFRALPLELIAGEDNFVTEVKENGLTLRFDYSKVFWNSRLSHEREVLCGSLLEGSVVVDVMAGAGALCCLAAQKKHCLVWANDLNPDAFTSLETNFRLNKVDSTCVAYNKDGNAFIRNFFQCRQQWLSHSAIQSKEVHFVMNLPQSAIDFLPAFIGVLNGIEEEVEGWKFVVHCYCFAKEEEHEQEIRERVTEKLPHTDTGNATIRTVRNIAPKKSMYCWTWTLDKGVGLHCVKKFKDSS